MVVIVPIEEKRYGVASSMAYLLAAAVASSVLGILLTFAPLGLYPAYAHPNVNSGILSLIRDGWGLSVGADQQLGGLLMWVPGGLIYLSAIFAVYARWQSSGDEDEYDEDVVRGSSSVVQASPRPYTEVAISRPGESLMEEA